MPIRKKWCMRSANTVGGAERRRPLLFSVRSFVLVRRTPSPLLTVAELLITDGDTSDLGSTSP